MQACPLPLPELVFRSYLERWRRVADAPLPVPLAEADLAASIALVDQTVSMHSLEFGAFRRGGFVGACSYALAGPPDRRRALAALADYAFYCGTGVKTALGMGQTRRLPLASDDARGLRQAQFDLAALARTTTGDHLVLCKPTTACMLGLLLEGALTMKASPAGD